MTVRGHATYYSRFYHLVMVLFASRVLTLYAKMERIGENAGNVQIVTHHQPMRVLQVLVPRDVTAHLVRLDAPQNSTYTNQPIAPIVNGVRKVLN